MVTVTEMLVVVPHCPASGVKVYVVVPAVAVLIVAGFQVPVILLFDVVGSAGAAEFWHKVPIAGKVGVALELTTMVMVVPALHCPPVGVKV